MEPPTGHENLAVILTGWPNERGRDKFHDWSKLSEVLKDVMITISLLNYSEMQIKF